MTDVQVFGNHPPQERRALWPAMKNGMRCKCPNCGEGALFGKFAKSVDSCAVCGEEIFHHRADDLPAYLNLFVVGHIVVGAYLMFDRITNLSAWTEVVLWTIIAVIMTIVLLQPVKGFVIGLQWANRMHGFGGDGEDGTIDKNIDPAHYG